MATRVLDRLLDMKSEYRQFTRVLDYRGGAGYFDALLTDADYHEDFGVRELIRCDPCHEMLHRNDDIKLPVPAGLASRTVTIPQDDAARLPFADNYFDLIVSSMSLHWVNRVPDVLKELHRVLKPNAPLVLAVPGNDSLYELRSSLLLADQERHGCTAPPSVSPMMRSSDLAALMGKAHGGAGFEVVTVDVDDLCIVYPDVYELMHDLQATGESNAVFGARTALNKEVLTAVDPIYRAMYGVENPLDAQMAKGLPATYSIIHGIGWKDGGKLPAPAQRGSATKSLKNL